MFLSMILMSGFSVSADLSQKKIMLASTIGPIDAGIVGALEEAFRSKTGIAVEHTGAGTGKAIQMAETGKYDLLLVHAKALEEKFVADGFGTKRYDLMYNDFVILGPSSDPAKIKGMKDAAAALRKISGSKSPLCYARRQVRNACEGARGLEESRASSRRAPGITCSNRGPKGTHRPLPSPMRSRPTRSWTAPPTSP